MKKQKQSFVVLGLGRFGSSVARSLCELGHEVLAVDRDEKLVENIAPDVTQAVQANAVDEDALAELGVQNFDAAIVAIGTDIRASILATVLLKEAGVPKVSRRPSMTSMPPSSIMSALTALSSRSAIWGSASPVRSSHPISST